MASDADDDPACQFDDSVADEDLLLVGQNQNFERKVEFDAAADAASVNVTDISVSAAERVVLGKEKVPDQFRDVFHEYPYFNLLQSKLLPDLLHSDNSVAVCAPTGSGKTALFELAIVRVLMQHEYYQTGEKFIEKIIYMSPLKSICAERVKDWAQKFQSLGLRVCELTGDSDAEDHVAAHSSNLIITTPEKWDAMTRKWRDANRTIMMQTRLICIDEVHLLSEPNRGATLETIVSRIKTAKQLSAPTGSSRAPVRFVAVSATAPNIGDVAQWLTVSRFPGKAFRMSQKDRPVKLTQIVRGIKSHSISPYAFDQVLSRAIAETISSYGAGKPTLVFCMTRLSASKSAKEVMDQIPAERDAQVLAERQFVTTGIRDKELRDVLVKGVGWHHAGLEYNDRQIVEDMFRRGLLQALFSTSTLAMGVNLPAYMVVLKGVHKCTGRSQTNELSETELLQMTGRAGRPQFDDHGVAVILCPEKDATRFQRLMNGEKVLESWLHKSLPEHVNSEVVLRTIHDKGLAVQWLKSTFFYIRCTKNRQHYGLSVTSTADQVNQHLSNLCIKELNGLNKYGMIRMKPDGSLIEPTEIGRIMAHYCVSFETMKSFVGVKPQSSLSDLLLLICSCSEVKQETVLRQDEKKILFSYSNLKDLKVPNVRFALQGKVREVEQKVFTIWQLEFGNIDPEDQRFRNDITKTLKVGKRMVRCLVDVLTLAEKTQVVGARTVRNAILLSQILTNGLWENTMHVVRQLRGIGVKYSNDMVRAGLSSFDSIRSRRSVQLDGLCNRKAPFGEELLRAVRALPIYHISGHQITEGPVHVRADFTVKLMNREHLRQIFNQRNSGKGPTAGRNHSFHLMVYGSDDKLLFHQKMRDEMLLNDSVSESVVIQQSEKEPRNRFTVSLISETWIGIDIRSREFVLTFTGMESIVRRDLFPDIVAPVIEQAEEVPAQVMAQSVASFLQQEDAEPVCKHKCKDKSLCLHNCCKTWTQVQRTVRMQFPMQQTSAVTKRFKSTAGQRSVRKGINVSFAEEDWLSKDPPETTPTPAAMNVTDQVHRAMGSMGTSDVAPVTAAPGYDNLWTQRWLPLPAAASTAVSAASGHTAHVPVTAAASNFNMRAQKWAPLTAAAPAACSATAAQNFASFSEQGDTEPVCKHKCADKSLCLHHCCKPYFNSWMKNRVPQTPAASAATSAQVPITAAPSDFNAWMKKPVPETATAGVASSAAPLLTAQVPVVATGNHFNMWNRKRMYPAATFPIAASAASAQTFKWRH